LLYFSEKLLEIKPYSLPGVMWRPLKLAKMYFGPSKMDYGEPRSFAIDGEKSWDGFLKKKKVIKKCLLLHFQAEF